MVVEYCHTKQTMQSTTEFTHVIVGGGLAGLALAWQLAQAAPPDTRIAVFERHTRWGGRILTVPGGKECAAFRVHRDHTHVLTLCKALGVELLPWTYATQVLPESSGPVSSAPQGQTPGMTQFDMAVLESATSMSAVSLRERRTGYFESFKHDAALRGAGKATSLTGSDFWYAPAGFTAMVEALVAKLGTFPNVTLRKATRVQDIFRQDDGYRVVLNDGGTHVAQPVVQAQSIWLALPPAAVAHFTMFRSIAGGLLHAAAVKAQPLHRLYARTGTLPGGSPDKQTRVILPESPLGQVWSTPRMADTPRDLVQVSYTEGRLAKFWQHLHQSSKRLTTKLLRTLLRRVAPAWQTMEGNDLESHYWDAAVHAWEASPSFRGPQETSELQFVHAVHLPRVCIVGEAVSSGQTWMEGALASVHAAVTSKSPALWTRKDLQGAVTSAKRRLLLIDGRIIDATTWMARHPGGRQAIQAHLLVPGKQLEDIGPLWERIHGHSEYARRELLYNTVAWLTQ